MRFNSRSIAIAGALAVVLAACGAATPAPTTAPTATAAPTLDAATKAWNDLVAAAKAEGQLNIVGGPEGSQADGGWYDAFGKQYGIKASTRSTSPLRAAQGHRASLTRRSFSR